MTNDKAAELLAAVRAVESGERPAASFFSDPARQTAPPARTAPAPRPAPGAGPGAGTPGAGGPVAVPAEVRALLTEGGAPEALGQRVVEALGDGAAEVLRGDPWQLLTVTGVRPPQADGFARALLGDEAAPDDPRRTEALVVWLLERAALSGHTVLDPAALGKGLSQHSVTDPEEAVRGAVDAGAALVFEDALDAGPVASAMDESGEEEEQERPVKVLVGLDRYALAEESLADGLSRVTSTFTPPGAELPAEPAEGPEAPESAPPAPPSSADWAAAATAAPSPSAGELIRAVSQHGLVTHTGGEAARAEPVALVAAARALGLRAWLTAHTDNGRARLAQLLGSAPGPGSGTDSASGSGPDAGHGGPESGSGPAAAGSPAPEPDGMPVATLTGLLSGAEGPGLDEDGTLALDLLAVCDAPQLEAETAAVLLESLPDGARLVLSGDPGVLGSAGPGQVFTDVMAARVCPHVASRTPDPGPVGELVSGIGIGELNEVAAPGKEVVIVPVGDPGEAVHRTVQLVADSVPRAIGVPTAWTQVITPGHGGAAGTRALNAALKERLNPGPGRFGGFDPGDRVAHSPAPGRTTLGTVASADETGLHLDCAGKTVTVPPEKATETVRHGWAVTAHQAAGARWPAAVVVLPGDAGDVLSREWIYTAFSRGERHLSVVQGAGEALPRAVTSVTAPERVTRLRTLLTESARAAEAAEAAEALRAAAPAEGGAEAGAE
ncbi:helix-hairpin-helix domain-containing protein [Streptomyces iconiensis]|uniref:Helix-hairpin-helix domain-containing protein n=1 Tax=Streptomyces iconiensis TaxID=1384038 RepID=A0ABT7A5M3_9ACTN|nr:helix-hairpin-helix domain-containing protein [Streptomyces iconiensis]MDJ1136362.1 helix-hairpin-helix domain-containing protein [Streptomyces iconiensis]